jgi:Fucosyltransferase, N-terminal
MTSRTNLIQKRDVSFHQPRLKHKLKIAFIGIVLLMILITFYIQVSPRDEQEEPQTRHVLFWTVFFNDHSWTTGPTSEAGEELLKSVNCPVTNCLFTHNKTLLDSITLFDAIIFHGPEYRTTALPTVRSPHQLYVFSSLE